jgi:hypothetical protein
VTFFVFCSYDLWWLGLLMSHESCWSACGAHAGAAADHPVLHAFQRTGDSEMEPEVLKRIPAFAGARHFLLLCVLSAASGDVLVAVLAI